MVKALTLTSQELCTPDGKLTRYVSDVLIFQLRIE